MIVKCEGILKVERGHYSAPQKWENEGFVKKFWDGKGKDFKIFVGNETLQVSLIYFWTHPWMIDF